MKVFIVFVSLILVFTLLGISSNELEKFKQINVTLKALAEEIACGGGLMTGSSDETDELCINLNDADSYANLVIGNASRQPLFKAGSLDYCLSLGDNGTSIIATVSYDTSKVPIFHFFEWNSGIISRSSTYEWVFQNVK